MDEKTMSSDEATRIVETLINLKLNNVITGEELKAALNRVEFYKDILVSD